MSGIDLSMLYEALYSLAKDEATYDGEGAPTELGRRFEEKVARTIWKYVRSSRAQPLPLRYTLNLPTISGHKHQFDAGFKAGSTTHLIECKRLKMTSTENIYYFNSKIIDYCLRINPSRSSLKIRGTFISSIEVGDPALTYALAYGLEVIDPVTPPLEVLISTSKDHKFRAAVSRLKEQMPSLEDILSNGYRIRTNTEEACKKYRFYVRRWLQR